MGSCWPPLSASFCSPYLGQNSSSVQVKIRRIAHSRLCLTPKQFADSALSPHRYTRAHGHIHTQAYFRPIQWMKQRLVSTSCTWCRPSWGSRHLPGPSGLCTDGFKLSRYVAMASASSGLVHRTISEPRLIVPLQFEIQGEAEPNSPIGSRLESQTNLEKSVGSKRRFALDRTISASSNPSKHADSPSWSRWAKPIDVPE
jgi:hypothetical protein